MGAVAREPWKHGGVVVFAIATCACAWFYAANLSCRVDDCFIYFRVANHLVHAHEPTYNLHDQRFIVTSPLWLFSITGAKLVFWGAELTLIAKYLYILFLVVASVFLRALIKNEYPLAASFAPLAVFWPAVAATCMGMETALCLAVALALIWSFQAGKWLLFGLFGGLFYLARAEGALLVAAMVATLAWRAYQQRRGFSEIVKAAWKPAAICALIVIAWHVYLICAFHQIFPDTLHTKIVQGLSGKWRLFHASIGANLYEAAHRSVWIGGVTLAGAAVLAARFRWIALWALIHVVAYSLLRVPDYMWYYYPLLFFAAIAQLIGADQIARLVARKRVVRACAASLLIGYVLCWANRPGTRMRTRENDPRHTAYLRVIEWIRAHPGANKTIVMDEIGIVGYYLDDYAIYDTVGLSNPNVTRKTMTDMRPPVKRYDPAFIVFRYKRGIRLPKPELSYKDANQQRVYYAREFSTELGSEFAALVYRKKPGA